MKYELPMNLQFFAEDTPKETDTPKEQPTVPSNEVPKDTPADDSKNAEKPKSEKELTEQLQSALVEIAKLKRAVDKSSSEAADYKKKWKESLSEAEQASMAKAEEQAKHEEEFESLKKQVKVNELTENFMDLGYSKELARKAANAQYDSDTQTLLDIQKQFQETQKKAWETEFLASRPELNAGVGSTQTISKEQFDNMTLIEKSQLRRDNKAEYDRLLAL